MRNGKGRGQNGGKGGKEEGRRRTYEDRDSSNRSSTGRDEGVEKEQRVDRHLPREFL
jgi:hypothetical protein